MADYTVISSVSRAILALLQRHMVPEILHSEDGIALSSPEEKGDMQLYAYLYNISECREIAQEHRHYGMGNRYRGQDSGFLYLYYLFTAVSSGDIRFRALEEQNILGKVIEIFNDYHSLTVPDFSGRNRPPESGVPIAMINLSQEEIGKVWSGLQMKHRLALFYRVGPVELESAQAERVTRVTDAEITIGERTVR